MQLDGAVHQTLDLRMLRDVGRYGGLVAQAKLARQRLKPVETSCPQHQLGPVPRQMAAGGFAQSAAGAGDDDDLVLDTLCHCFQLSGFNSLAGQA
jgi:hypothetical protein